MKILLLIICMFVLSGCDNRECVKSHEENTICPRAIIINGRSSVILVPCTKTICDEYEEIK